MLTHCRLNIQQLCIEYLRCVTSPVHSDFSIARLNVNFQKSSSQTKIYRFANYFELKAIESVNRLIMAAANQRDENLLEMYTRLIAENDAEMETIQANLEKEKATNDQMKNENAELELKIETGNKMLKKTKWNIYDNMILINSRINSFTRLIDAKKIKSIICAELALCKEVKVLGEESAEMLTFAEGLKVDFERKQVIFDTETNQIQMLAKYGADADALEKGFDDMVNKIEMETSDAINSIDISFSNAQKRNIELKLKLRELGIIPPDAKTSDSNDLIQSNYSTNNQAIHSRPFLSDAI